MFSENMINLDPVLLDPTLFNTIRQNIVDMVRFYSGELENNHSPFAHCLISQTSTVRAQQELAKLIKMAPGYPQAHKSSGKSR